MSHEVVELTIEPSFINTDPIKGAGIHVNKKEYFLEVLRNFMASNKDGMAWIIITKENGSKVSYLKKCDGTIFDTATGQNVNLDQIV